MARRTVFVVALFFISQNGLAQATLPDAAVIIYQSTLNGFLDAIGPLSGKGKFNVVGIEGAYTWTLKNARIELAQDQARFTADANIKAGALSYSSVASGDVEIKYIQETNRIHVKVLQAIVEVYTKIFGKKIHITNIDAAKIYRPEFEFSGPQPVQPSVVVNLPDSTTKTIYIMPLSQNLKLEPGQILVTSRLVFSDQPPQPNQGPH